MMPSVLFYEERSSDFSIVPFTVKQISVEIKRESVEANSSILSRTV